MPRMRFALLLAVLLFVCPSVRPAPPETKPPSVRSLVKQLRTGDVLQRQDAAEALGRMGPRAAEAIPALAAAMKDRSLCRPAAFALAAIGPKAAPALVKALDGDAEKAAAAALARMGRSAVPALRAVLKGTDGEHQRKVFAILSMMGPRAEDAIPDLVECLQTSRPYFLLRWYTWTPNVAGLEPVRLPDLERVGEGDCFAAPALASIGPRAVPALVQILDRRRRRFRRDRLLGIPGTLGHALIQGFKNQEPATHALLTASVLVLEMSAALEALRENDCRARTCAAAALAEMGPAARAAVPALVRALDDPEKWVRHHAIDALAKIGPQARAAVPALIRLLASKYGEENSVQLVKALKAIGLPAREVLERDVIAVLVQRLQQKGGDDENSANCLALLSPHARSAVPALRRMLQRPLSAEHAEGILVALCGAGADAVPVLTETLGHHANDEIRIMAAGVLSMMRPRLRSALPALRTALLDRDPEVRKYARYALIELETDPDKIVALLIECLSEEGSSLSDEVIRRLLAQGQHAQPAIPVLQKALDDRDDEVVLIAAQALLMLDVSPCKPLARLSQLIAKQNDARKHTFHSFFNILHQLGSRARGVAPALEAQLKDPDLAVRLRAVCLLCEVNPSTAKRAGRALRKWLQEETFLSVSNALSQLGHKPEVLVPSPTSLNPSGFVILGKLAAITDPVVPELVVHLQAKDTAPHAARALGSMGPKAAAALPDLLPLLRDGNASIRGEAAFALGQLGRAARAAVPRLRPLLDDEDAGVRLQAAAALLNLTGDTKRMVPLLVRELRSGDHEAFCRDELRCLNPSVRRAVVRALAEDLHSSRPVAFRAAVKVLAQLGTEARGLAPRHVARLRQLADCDDEDIATCAGKVLAEIAADGSDRLLPAPHRLGQ